MSATPSNPTTCPRCIDGLLSEAADDAMDIYPMSTIENGVRRDRTPYEDGWNAARLALSKRQCELQTWYGKLPDDQKDALVRLLADDGTLHLFGSGEQVRLLLNVNDFFVPGGDAEEITLEQLVEVASWHRKHGSGGVMAWVAHRRGEMPWRERERPEFNAALAELRAAGGTA